jgi:hypothetical protein
LQPRWHNRATQPEENGDALVSGLSSIAPNRLPSLHRDAVVVLGMHRSGTSALSRAFSFYGFAQPQDVMLPQPDNPKGFWEPRGVVELNTAILSALGGSWQRPGPFLVTGLGSAASRARIRSVINDNWLDAAVSVLRHSYGDSPSIVIKDPRVVPLLPLWEQAVAKSEYTPHYVLIYRNPLEVAASLRARNNEIKPRVALQLWTLYNLAALDAVAAPGFAGAVSYDELLADPAAALTPILGRMGLADADPCIQPAEGLRDYLSPAERHHEVSAEALNASPRVPSIVKDLWTLLAGWNKIEVQERSLRITALRATFDDMTLFSGPIVGVPATMLQGPTRAAEKVGSAALRPATSDSSDDEGDAETAGRMLILHYHLFKNAGSSIDEMLKHNFGEKWVEQEFKTTAGQSNTAEVAAYLREQLQLCALSSHTALLPVPLVDGLRIFPIIFLRHPIDRLRSAYMFERKQLADTFGARLAKATDFAGYLKELLDHPVNRTARNFQTFRLAFNEPPEAGSEYERSLRALASLPLVGLVEAYERSVESLRLALLPFYPDFAPVMVRKNVTRSAADPLDARLAEVKEELGRDLFERLCEANADDIHLFKKVQVQYADA